MLDTVVKQAPLLPLGSKMLIFGGGFTGRHVAYVARALGAQVLCSHRTKSDFENDFVFNSDSEELPSIEIFNNVTHLLSCIPPGENGRDPVIEKLGKTISQIPLAWAGYLSTTGVYGDTKGAWVNESDIPKPQQLRSKRRLQCEKEWESLNLPTQILRLPGIYGYGRSALESIENNKCKLIDKPKQIFSRIHVDDIAGAIMHLISLSQKGNRPNIVNISDNLPTANIEVLSYAAKLLNKSLPSVEPFEIAAKAMSPMALSFWQENRRVSNKLLCENLRYSLIHPDYRSGLKECFYQLKN
tara:strand:+ start:1616 stop:2512 length:897 start_codon:yes stop_codon:yes gene_type:complete